MISIRSGIIHRMCGKYICRNILKDIISHSEAYYKIEDFNKFMQSLDMVSNNIDIEDKCLINTKTIKFKYNNDLKFTYLLNKCKIKGEIDFNNYIKYDINQVFDSITNKYARDYSYPLYVHKNIDIYSCDLETLSRYIELSEKKKKKVKAIMNHVQTTYKNGEGKDKIDLKVKPFDYNKIGIKIEPHVISRLTDVGFEIESKVETLKKKENSLKICGKPDGYVINSPYGKDFYLEIKYKPNYKPSEINDSDMHQMATYAKVTGKDVLLVICDENMNLTFKYNTYEKLNTYWIRKEKILMKNADIISRLINIKTIEDFRRLKFVLTKNRIDWDDLEKILE